MISHPCLHRWRKVLLAAAATISCAAAEVKVSSHAPLFELHSAVRQAPDGVHVVRVPVQTPPEHTGPTRHLSESEHGVQLVLFEAVQSVPAGVAGSHAPTVQSVVLASQLFGATEHMPFVHVPLAALQPLLPHAVLSPTAVSTQLPEPVSHVAAVWQSRCTHFTVCAVSATHTPDLQLSFGVHAFPSALQAAASLNGYVHALATHVPGPL